MIQNEHAFSSARPGTGAFVWNSWYTEPLSSYDGYYTWRCSDTAGGQVQAAASEPAARGARPAATRLRDLHVLSCADRPSAANKVVPMAASPADRQQRRWAGQDSENFYYRAQEVVGPVSGPCTLTAQESVDRATSFVAAQGIAAPDELTLDGVVAIRQMAVTAEEITARQYHNTPQTVGYLVRLKRDLGDLPLRTNDTDTIMVEIGRGGQVVRATSNYRTGRTVEQRESIVPRFATIEEAKQGLVPSGTEGEVTAGLLPLEDGAYLPVFRVTTPTPNSELSPGAQVRYLRMDTLAPVQQQDHRPAGPEIQANGPAPQQVR